MASSTLSNLLRPAVMLFAAHSIFAMQLPKFEEEDLAMEAEAAPQTAKLVEVTHFPAGSASTAAEAAEESLGLSETSNSSSSSSATTVGLFTRVTEADLPYVASFFKHYASIGVSHFYLMNTDFEKDHKDIMQYIQAIDIPSKPFMDFMHLDVVDHSDPLRTPGLTAALEEEFVINVDIDEYWVLPSDVSSIQELVQVHPADIYYMRWVMVVSDELDAQWSTPYEGTVGFPGKWMARRALIPMEFPKRYFGHHVVPLKSNAEPQVLGDYQYGMSWQPGADKGMKIDLFGRSLPAYSSYTPGYMAHFWCRSFYDVVLKTTRYNKGQSCTSLSSFAANMSDVSDRMKTLAFLELNTKEPVKVDSGRDLLQIDKALERSMAREAACEGSDDAGEKSIVSFHDKYLGYKEHLSTLMAAGAYPELWPETALSMPSSSGKTVADWLAALP